MKKVQLGAGGHRLNGWENYDREVDIRQRLPFPSASVDRIFCEHTIEHVSQADGVRFLLECRRVLRPGGRLRLSFPCVPANRVFSGAYHELARSEGFEPVDTSDHPSRPCLRLMFFHWGHRSIWTVELAVEVCLALGFHNARREFYGESSDPELRLVDGRHHGSGRQIAEEETGIIEAWVRGNPSGARTIG